MQYKSKPTFSVRLVNNPPEKRVVVIHNADTFFNIQFGHVLRQKVEDVTLNSIKDKSNFCSGKTASNIHLKPLKLLHSFN